jgi:thymidylate synthase (FAD)
MIKIKENKLFTDKKYYNSKEPGFVSIWDFSKANLSHKNRVTAVSTVASVCYGNNSLEPNFKLFDKLARESIGLPSSSFEFVPVLLNEKKIDLIINKYTEYNIRKIPRILKFSYRLEEGDDSLITNLRALWIDIKEIQKRDKNFFNIENKIWYNNDEEAKIIKRNVFVFNKKITIRDARQFNRHRVSLQELSRRYTTGSKVPIEYRLILQYDENLNKKIIEHMENSISLYNELLQNNIKAQEARDILPVSIYTQIWSLWFPDQFDNFIKLRTASSSQTEIRELAENMKELAKIVGWNERKKDDKET